MMERNTHTFTCSHTHSQLIAFITFDSVGLFVAIFAHLTPTKIVEPFAARFVSTRRQLSGCSEADNVGSYQDKTTKQKYKGEEKDDEEEGKKRNRSAARTVFDAKDTARFWLPSFQCFRAECGPIQ